MPSVIDPTNKSGDEAIRYRLDPTKNRWWAPLVWIAAIIAICFTAMLIDYKIEPDAYDKHDPSSYQSPTDSGGAFFNVNGPSTGIVK